MSDFSPERDEEVAQNAQLQRAVIVGLIPDQSPRVLEEAMRFAGLLSAPLVVVHVDVARFVTYEDPDGFVHSSPLDLNVDAGAADFEAVQAAAAAALEGSELTWTVRKLAGDPALSMKKLADTLDAQLLVVGTRKRGLGESIREFFTGSVAARLAHRQHRSVLVVPLQEPVADHKEIWGD